MMFLSTGGQNECAQTIAQKIGEYLKQDKKILWLLPGGSNIPISVSAFNMLNEVSAEKLKTNLAVTLTDERFGPVGHSDSNWQQLIVSGFLFSAVAKAVPVLSNLSLEETVITFSKNYRDLINWADVIVGQFGIGPDGHIAGVLPKTLGVDAKSTACGYQAEKFVRISLTLNTIKGADVAYAFALGSNKKEIISLLQTKELPLSEMPAQILKQIPESYLFGDRI